MLIFSVFILLLSDPIQLTEANNLEPGKAAPQNSYNCTPASFPGSALAGGGGAAGKDQTPKTPQDWKKLFKLDADDFLKLKLNDRELRGSRWTLEQKNVVDVYHAIEIMDVTLINNNELTLRVEFNLRQQWIAEGLEFPHGLFTEADSPGAFITASEEILKDMWSPDSYVSTSRESNMNTRGAKLSLVNIFKNSTIIFKVRMYTKVACSSSFQWYPLDVQTCDLTIESYKYHDDIVRYHWTDESVYRPLMIHNRRLFQYELQLPPKYDSGTVTRGGRGTNYSYIRVKFTFERKLGNNFIQVYTPTVLVVVLSWFSFWLGLDAIPGRISLLVTCMLTMVTMHSGMKGSIPPVHYITMMDVWYVCCMAFVFSAMCEFVIVKYLHWRQQQKKRAEEKKYQEETRQQLYNLFSQHSVKGKGAGAADGKVDKVIDNEYGGGNPAGNMLPFMDKQTTLASSYWTAATAGMRNPSKNFASDQILQQIIVGEMMGVGGGGLDSGNGSDDDNEGNRNDNNQRYDKKEEDNLGGHGGGPKVMPLYVSMDRFCRGFLPFLFCVFNAVYWPVLFTASEEQKV